MKVRLSFLISLSILMIAISPACKTKQAGVPSAVNTGSDNANAQAEMQHGGVSGAKVAGGRVFRGRIGDKKIEMTLLRDGDQVSGTYFYQKIGNDISLKGTIDGKGNLALQEFDNSGKQTGEFKGKWDESANLPAAVLDGTWSKPNSKQTLGFSATEQLAEFSSGQRFVTKEIKEEDKTKRYSITAEYPELTGATNPNSEKFNKVVKTLVTKHTGDFKKGVLEMTEEELNIESESGDYIGIDYDVMLANDELISVAFGVSTYSRGAAHPNYYTDTLTFDIKTGATLKLADLFKPGSDYLAVISRYSIDDLKKQAGDDNYDSEWVEKGAGPDGENYTSWNISKKGLAITFDPYQVASYAEGPKHVIVPFATLKAIAKPDGVLLATANRK